MTVVPRARERARRVRPARGMERLVRREALLPLGDDMGAAVTGDAVAARAVARRAAPRILARRDGVERPPTGGVDGRGAGDAVVARLASVVGVAGRAVTPVAGGGRAVLANERLVMAVAEGTTRRHEQAGREAPADPACGVREMARPARIVRPAPIMAAEAVAHEGQRGAGR